MNDTCWSFQVHDVDDNTDSSIFYITVIDINNNKPVFIFPDDTTEIRLNIEVSSRAFIFHTFMND
jgi:hypothetical protein